MFKTASTAAFLEAWRVLSSKTQTPHFRAVFQDLPSDLIPRILVIEVAPKDEYVIRFMGTSRAEMWGQELTGKSPLEVMSYPVASAARQNLGTMLAHPCGMYHIAHYNTALGRDVLMEHITMPAANDPGMPRRLINFAEEVSTVAYSEPAG